MGLNLDEEKRLDLIRQIETKGRSVTAMDIANIDALETAMLDLDSQIAKIKEDRRVAELTAVERQIEAIHAAEVQGQISAQAIWESGWQGKFETVSDIFGNLSALMNSESRKMFEIGKVAAIAQATIDTIAGAQKVFTALAFNPPLAYAAAGAAYAAGMVRVQQIASTSFSGGARGGGGGGGGITGSAAAPTQDVSSPNQGGPGSGGTLSVSLPTLSADQFVSVERLQELAREARRRNLTIQFTN